MNTGTLVGTSRLSWKNFPIEWRCASNTTATDPVMATSRMANQCRWAEVPGTRFVFAQYQCNLLSGSTVGTGDAYVFRLPKPFYRWQGDSATSRIPIGQGIAYEPFQSPAYNMPVMVMPSDPWLTLGGDHDNYFQVMCSRLVSRGDTTQAAAATSTTVNHGLGFAMHASDIEATITGVPGSLTQNDPCDPFVRSNITSTSFDLVTRNTLNNAATTAFSWRVSAVPTNASGAGSAICGPNVPWTWYGSGLNVLFLQLFYEARA